MPFVRYIGAKERKEDNVAGTGAIWDGFGDVVEIRNAAAASKLARHSLVWEIVAPEIVAPESAQQAPRQIEEPVGDDEQKLAAPGLANLSLGNPEHHDDDDGQVAAAPGATPPMPGTATVPPVATAAGPRQSAGPRSGASRNGNNS